MNKNYEWCVRCNRRKFLTTGCLRRWFKPVECKHLQRSIDNKNNYSDTDLTNCMFKNERKTSITTNRFLKYCKTKLSFTSRVRSLQHYFSRKAVVSNNDYNCNFDESYEGSTSDKKLILAWDTDTKRGTEVVKNGSLKGFHAEGHHCHMSPDSCAIYCQLSKHGWYWGSITKSEAEQLLAGQDDNVFLVRDSYSSRHLLCVSFRCVGRTLHTRLRHANGLFSLNNETFVPVSRISEHCATVNVSLHLLGNGGRLVGLHLIDNAVRLARPLNRFAKLDSLQMICRFVIRQSTSDECLHKLPLPPDMIAYISNGSDYIISSSKLCSSNVP